MKTLKFSTLLVALASVFTFSSCLNDDDNDYGNVFRSYVTISGDNLFGYTFYSDFGCKLIPDPTSVQTILPGLANSSAKRAIVAFELIGDETTTQLKAGETYHVNLVNDYYANYALPTFSSINTDYQPAATDSLTTKNKGQISYVNSNIWAINGYVNAEMNIMYGGNTQPFYMHTYYDATDVDVANNTLTLKLYYNSNTTNSYTQAQSVFSFDLPDEIYSQQFSKDTINLVLKARTNNTGSFDLIGDAEMNEVGRCKVALKDFLQPMPY